MRIIWCLIYACLCMSNNDIIVVHGYLNFQLHRTHDVLHILVAKCIFLSEKWQIAVIYASLFKFEKYSLKFKSEKTKYMINFTLILFLWQYKKYSCIFQNVSKYTLFLWTVDQNMYFFETIKTDLRDIDIHWVFQIKKYIYFLINC